MCFVKKIVYRYVLQKRRVLLSPEQARDLYAEHFGKLFFPSLVAYMSSGPIIVLLLGRENAISHWRELVGPTSVSKARETHPDRYIVTLSVISGKSIFLLLLMSYLLQNPMLHVFQFASNVRYGRTAKWNSRQRQLGFRCSRNSLLLS